MSDVIVCLELGKPPTEPSLTFSRVATLTGTKAAKGGAPPHNGIKLHIGGWEARQGWSILDVNPGPHVDHVGNCNDPSFLQDSSCSEIYASHVLEHLGYNGEMQATLKGFHRVLKPGGRLRVSVPDLEILCRLFLHPDLPVAGKFHVMRMMFGGRMDAHDVHYCGLSFPFLSDFMTEAEFR